MSKDWINIPTSNNDFNAPMANIVLSVLDDTGILEINGADSAKFLQGQLTCNLQEISLQQSSIGAHCTHKGRMIASFTLCQNSEISYLFSLSQETLSGLEKSLGKYIVFSKAKLRNVSDDYLTLGISGTNASQLITTLFGHAPTVRHEQHLHNNSIVTCISEQAPRFLCLIPTEQAQTSWGTLTASATVTDHHYWNRLNICEGIGEVREQTVEEFIPQMLNLQKLGGISFTKGCYTGQEIVARMQYRGILKKGMYRIAGQGKTPAPNDPVFQQGEMQAVGHLVMAEATAVNHWEGLAVITHDAVQHALHSTEKLAIAVLPLPYSLAQPE